MKKYELSENQAEYLKDCIAAAVCWWSSVLEPRQGDTFKESEGDADIKAVCTTLATIPAWPVTACLGNDSFQKDVIVCAIRNQL